jgi:hypothetical protein
MDWRGTERRGQVRKGEAGKDWNGTEGSGVYRIGGDR